MPHKKLPTLIVFVLVLCFSLHLTALAQGSDVSELKERVEKLINENNYLAAAPLLEKIIAAEPDNGRMQFYFGFALLAQSTNTNDENSQRSLRIRARNAFIKARELAYQEPLLDGLIQGIPVDGAASPSFSTNIEANRIMNRAEASFTQGNLDDALKNYQAALKLDPNLYYAALFSGDVYMQKQDFEQAEVWYQKAIAIDPTRETAYRYSATPLMKQKRYSEARDRYIEAYISEPFNRFAQAGITQWAQVTQTQLSHPRIDIPTNVTFDEKGDAKINLDASALLGGKDDGSFAWISYGATRSHWHKEKFAKTFPNEKTYRHSLPEEADALRSVVSLAASEKAVKKLSPSLELLKRLNDDGLLEAYVLLAKADREIMKDYPGYLKGNRDKLRRYVVDWVVNRGNQ